MSLAKKLDEDITKLLDDDANLSVTKAAVFYAMDYLDEYRRSTGSAENMRSQIQDYIADATRGKLAEDKVKAENEVLRREAAALREQLEKMPSKRKLISNIVGWPDYYISKRSRLYRYYPKRKVWMLLKGTSIGVGYIIY